MSPFRQIRTRAKISCLSCNKDVDCNSLDTYLLQPLLGVCGIPKFRFGSEFRKPNRTVPNYCAIPKSSEFRKFSEFRKKTEFRKISEFRNAERKYLLKFRIENSKLRRILHLYFPYFPTYVDFTHQ